MLHLPWNSELHFDLVGNQNPHHCLVYSILNAARENREQCEVAQHYSNNTHLEPELGEHPESGRAGGLRGSQYLSRSVITLHPE